MEAQVSARSSSQRPLSCKNCRQRKTKCDRVVPCEPCQRAGLECEIPERAKRPRKGPQKKKVSTQDLLERLRKMESLIGTVSSESSSSDAQESMRPSKPPWMSIGLSNEDTGMEEMQAEGRGRDEICKSRLKMDRYIGVGFWRTLTSEVEGLREAINDDSDETEEEDNADYPDTATKTQRRLPAMLFDSSFHAPEDLKTLHPSPMVINKLTELFIANVDPMCKFMHVPTLRLLVAEVTSDVANIPKGNYVEALLFAIYYAATTSLTNDQCLHLFLDGRASLLSRFRAGVERAFANAHLMNTKELGVLQAFCLFLLALRANDSSHLSWTLCALLVRLCQSMGLHRKSLSTGISTFAREMGRRLWWHIIVLDTRSSEDRASEPVISPSSFDTLRPSNLNDEDLSPEMTVLPPPRPGFTEMHKASVHYEVCFLRWKFGEIPHFNFRPEQSHLSLKDRIQLVSDFEQTLNERVIRHCDPSVPVAWVTSVVARLVMCRIRLMLYHPIEPTVSRADIPHISNEKLLETAVACMEYMHLLEAEPTVAHWRWFARTYVQWHALATCLAELCMQTKGPLVDRAWKIVNTVFDDWAARIADSPKGMLWRPIKKLMAKAQAKRLQSQQFDQRSESDEGQCQQLLPELETLGFEPSIVRPSEPSTATTVSEKQPSLDSSFNLYAIPEMPPFDGLDDSSPENGTWQAADTNGPPDNTGSWSLDATNVPAADMSLGFANTQERSLEDGTLEGQQDLPQFSIPSTAGGVSSGGEINWAEWDEFMAGFDWIGDPGRDVEMGNFELGSGENGVFRW